MQWYYQSGCAVQDGTFLERIFTLIVLLLWGLSFDIPITEPHIIIICLGSCTCDGKSYAFNRDRQTGSQNGILILTVSFSISFNNSWWVNKNWVTFHLPPPEIKIIQSDRFHAFPKWGKWLGSWFNNCRIEEWPDTMLRIKFSYV